MTWKKSQGFAIAIHPFIAFGTKQVSLLTGDYFVVYDELEGWYHGQNLVTQIDGIFPKSCVQFIPHSNISKVNLNELFQQDADLLRIEAQLTMNYALRCIDFQSSNTEMVTKATLSLEQVVVVIHEIERAADDASKIFSLHEKLANSIDQLRESLKLAKIPRTKNHEYSTLTTWGEEQFLTSVPNKMISNPGYVVLHFNIQIEAPKKELYYRFFLYQRISQKAISDPVIKLLGPENPHCDILFNYFEKKLMKNETYLICYIYDIIPGLSDNKKDPLRTTVGIGSVKLPSLKAEVGYKKENQELLLVTKFSTSNYYTSGAHKQYVAQTKQYTETLKPLTQDIRILFTPYFGDMNEYIFNNDITDPLRSTSLLLPSVLKPQTLISKLYVEITGVNQRSSRKRAKIVARVLDKSTNKFISCIDPPFGDKKRKVDHYSTVSFVGIKDKNVKVSEMFTIDLSTIPPEKLSNLRVVFELDRCGDGFFSSSSFVFVPITNQMGLIQPAEKQKATLYHFKIRNLKTLKVSDYENDCENGKVGKPAGVIKYNFSFCSTQLSASEPLFKLLHYESYKSELGDILQSFTQCGMNEWIKFLKDLLYTLLKIINTKTVHQKPAFEQLNNIITEVLARGRKEYIDQIEGFSEERFHTNDPNMEDCQTIRGIYNYLIPLSLESVTSDTTSQQFRNILKCSPFLFDISMKSIMIYKQQDRIEISPIHQQLRDYFKRLNDIVKEVPDNSDYLKKGTVFTNQQLILQNFPKIITSLLQNIDPDFIADRTVQFIKSIRFVENDKKQVPIDKSKMRVLLAISQSKAWIDPHGRQILSKVFTPEIEKAAKLSHCLPFLGRIFASLYIYGKDDYICQFIDLIFNTYKSELTNKDQKTSQLLKHQHQQNANILARVVILIIYYFPSRVPYTKVFDLIRYDQITPQIRLFVFLNYFLSQRDKFCEMMKKSDISREEKNSTIELFFSLSVLASQKSSSPLDNGLSTIIYPRSIDYSSCRVLFEALPVKERVIIEAIDPLLHCSIMSKSNDLKMIFVLIVKADIENNGGKAKLVMQPTLQSLYKLSRLPRFENIMYMFEDIPERNKAVIEFFDTYKRIAISLQDYRKLFVSIGSLSANGDKLATALNVLIEACRTTNDVDLMPRSLLRIAQLHLSLGSFLEAAKAYELLLDYVPCNHDILPPHLQIENAKSGLEFHINVMIKIINIYMGANCDEYGLRIVKRFEETVVKPFQFVDMMKTILDKQYSIYQNIATKERKFSNYFLATFTGNGFDEYYDKNRSFIYRKPSDVDLDTFARELQSRYRVDPSNINSNPASNDTDQHIQILPLQVAYEEELNDYLYQNDSKQINYILTFKLNQEPSLFKYESEDKTELKQVFYKTQQGFPCLNGRLEIVDDKQITKRTLKPEQKVQYRLQQFINKAESDTYTYFQFFNQSDERKNEIQSSGILTSFTNTLNLEVNKYHNGQMKKIIEQYVKGKNTPDANNIKALLKKHMQAVEQGINIDFRIAPIELKGMIAQIQKTYMEAKMTLNNLLA